MNNNLREKWQKYLVEGKPNLFADCYIEGMNVQNWWISEIDSLLDSFLKEVEEKKELTKMPIPPNCDITEACNSKDIHKLIYLWRHSLTNTKNEALSDISQLINNLKDNIK